MKTKVTKAMILAGGLGTRFLPVTLAGAKELIAVGNKPILMYHLEDLIKAGVTDVLIVGNKLKEQSFKNFLNPSEEYIEKIVSGGKLGLLEGYNNIRNNLNITYVNQDDQFQLIDGQMVENDMYNKMGSSIAIYAGKAWAAGEPFIIINGDDLCYYRDGRSVAGELIETYEQSGGDYVMYGKIADMNEIWKYSSMVLGDKFSKKGQKMLDIIEKPEKGKAPSNVMGFARYIFNPDFFEAVKTVPARGNGEFCMVDVFAEAARAGHGSCCMFDGIYHDCGSMTGYVAANVDMAMQDPTLAPSIKKAVEEVIASNEPGESQRSSEK